MFSYVWLHRIYNCSSGHRKKGIKNNLNHYNVNKNLLLIIIKVTFSRDHMYEVVDREYVAEKKAAAKEFEEKKVELRENLLTDFEDKRKLIESERHSMELNGDSMEVT